MTNKARTAVGIGLSLLMVPPLAWVVFAPPGASDPATAPAVAATPAPQPTAEPTIEEVGGVPVPGPDPEPMEVPAPPPPPVAPPAPPAEPAAPAAAPAPPAPPTQAPPSRPATNQAAGSRAGGGQAVPAGCSTRPIRPTRFQVPRMGVDAPMMTVGKDSSGNPGAPPLSQMFSTAWYRGSPAPGSSRGNVIVNVHSYARGAALGNNLNAGSGLRAGDVIRVVGEDGQVACYRFREKIKFSVASYRPDSGVYFNATGRPQLAIMTCWDRNSRTGEYESRIIFYADRVL